MIFRDYFRERWGDGVATVKHTQVFNAFFRSGVNVNYGSKAKDVFKTIDSMTDDELLDIKGIGVKGMQRLRNFSSEWKQELLKSNRSTRFNDISADWTRVKNHCRTTVNKEFTDNEPRDEFKQKLLISEHSPIRLLEVDWTWEDIPSWVATHWSRHKFEKFISTQRSDRTESATPRSELFQDAPVTFDGFANMQSLIDAWRKRMCFQASPETRKLAEQFKVALHDIYPEMADVLVPNCVYRCGCPEFTPCGWFDNVKWPDNCNMMDIRHRYEAYNKWFYANH